MLASIRPGAGSLSILYTKIFISPGGATPFAGISDCTLQAHLALFGYPIHLRSPMRALLKENKKTLALAFPIIAGQLSQMLMGLVDTLMIGRLGTVELAAAAFVNVLFFLAFVPAIGWFAAVSVQVSHAYGANRQAESAESFRNGLLASVLIGLVLSCLLLAAIPLLGLLRQPPEVVAMTPPYLLWIALSLIPIVPAMTIKSFAESRNHPWAVFWILLSSVALNVILNYALIFGNLGAPALGLVGAGLATFIARALSLAALLLYLNRSKAMSPGRPQRWLKRLDRGECLETTRMAVPIAGQLLMEIGAFTVAALLIGQFGPVALASHQIVLSCASFTFMLPLGLSMAVTIRVGHSLGRGDAHQCRDLLAGAHLTTLLMMGSCALAYILAGDRIAAAFSADPEVIALTSAIFIVVAFFQIFDGIQIISMGALRALKDVNVPTVIIFACFWMVGIPLGALLGFPYDFGAQGLWMGLASGLVLAALTLSIRLVIKMSAQAKENSQKPSSNH
ncbi:MAG: MATE family efflux transporter [Puniceicoccaceae bacterium]|nr:MAG: MATE family efflux transporter [Puniceicoccaceae bacterium]